MPQTILEPLCQNHSLQGIYRPIGGDPKPDYTALWVILGIFTVIAAVVIGVLLYRNWRKKNCCPIYFAGKVRYARKGETIYDACSSSGFEADWLLDQKYDLGHKGYRVTGLYIDPDLTIPLDEKQIVKTPVHIYPKIEQ